MKIIPRKRGRSIAVLKQTKKRAHQKPDILGTQSTGAFIVEVLQRVTKKIGASLVVEPEWGCVGQITYPSGIRRYFRLSTLDLNTMGASEIARDKGYSRFFLEKMGYSIPKGKTFLSPKWAKTLRTPNRGKFSNAQLFAKSIGLPVFVKPNSLSRGTGVSKATTWSEFRRSVNEALKHDKVIVIEQAIVGRDYRLVVLDGRVISAYERIPLEVIGDGVSTIGQLLEAKQKQFILDDRETPISRKDFRLQANLRRNRLTFKSILKRGHKVQLLDNANLSAGGTSVDVTDEVHPAFKELTAKIANDMGLRLVGVDIMTRGNLASPPKKGNFWIIEVNSAPGLDHYASMGDRQKQIVDDLYLQVVKAMERPQE